MKEQEKDDILTAEEAAEYLRMALSTLYRYMRGGKVPCFKVGNQWRFKRSVLDRWMDRLSSFPQMSSVDVGWSLRSVNKEGTMKKEEKEGVGFDLGLGGLFKGLGSLLELAAELAEKAPAEIRREGRVGSIPRKGLSAVYGFSVKVGGEGRPIIEHFGNVRDEAGKGPVVDEVREPMVDTFDEGDFFLVVAEMPGVNEADVQYEVKGDILTVSGQTGDRKYYKEVLLPDSVEEKNISSSSKNGILEMKLWKARGQ